MEFDKVSWVVFLMALVTAACRLIPVLVIQGKDLPPLLLTFLRFAPVAILTAMLGPGLFLMNGQIDLSLENPFFWVSVFCFTVAIGTKSIPLTVLLGVTLLAVWRWYMG